MRESRWIRRLAVLITAVLVLAGCAKPAADSGEDGSAVAPNEITIALSNSFIGNTWRQTMVRVFEQTASQAKADGLIKDFSVNNTSQNTATEQIAQIKALILKQPSAILINSASGTALNPVIEEACAAGIVVITFDSVATADCAYKEEADLKAYGSLGARGVLDAMDGRGKLLLVRGVVGSAPEKIIYDAQRAEVDKRRDVEIVSELQGEASNPTTQQAVQGALSSLPQIDGVITGGSTFGALQAFQSAGKDLPPGNFANDGTDLALWKKLRDQDPEFSATSVRPDPGQSALAFWMALEILAGNEVPKQTMSPNIVVTDETLDDWIAVTPDTASAAWQWTRAEAQAAIAAQNEGREMPEPATPTEAP